MRAPLPPPLGPSPLHSAKKNNIYNGQIHHQKEQVLQRTSKPNLQKEITFQH